MWRRIGLLSAFVKMTDVDGWPATPYIPANADREIRAKEEQLGLRLQMSQNRRQKDDGCDEVHAKL